MPWPTGVQPYGPNRAPLLVGLSSVDGKTPIPVAVDPTTGEIETTANFSGSVTVAGNTNANMYTGQQTVNTTQVQISGSSHSLNNGMIVKSLSTNAANIEVGLTGVTATTGDILEPGESRWYPVNNTNLLYIISATSTTDKISYEAN